MTYDIFVQILILNIVNKDTRTYISNSQIVILIDSFIMATCEMTLVNTMNVFYTDNSLESRVYRIFVCVRESMANGPLD